MKRIALLDGKHKDTICKWVEEHLGREVSFDIFNIPHPYEGWDRVIIQADVSDEEYEALCSQSGELFEMIFPEYLERRLEMEEFIRKRSICH